VLKDFSRAVVRLGLARVGVVFEDRPVRLATSMESSRLYLLYGFRSIAKINKNTYYLRFIFLPKTGKNSLKQVFRFYCEGLGRSEGSSLAPTVDLTFLRFGDGPKSSLTIKLI